MAEMDDDDLDFDLPKSQSRSAKKGRRAAEMTKSIDPPDAPTFDDEEIPSSRSNRKQNLSEDSPPRPSRVSGWGEDAPRKKRNLGEGFEAYEDERLRPRSPEQDEDSDNEIPVIPDLEDQHEEDLSSNVAVAPNVAVNRVATYRELDNDLLRQAAFLTLDGDIDLKLLTKSLSTEADLLEEDKPWDWDRLFTEVTSELLTQYEKSDHSESEPIPAAI